MLAMDVVAHAACILLFLRMPPFAGVLTAAVWGIVATNAGQNVVVKLVRHDDVLAAAEKERRKK